MAVGEQVVRLASMTVPGQAPFVPSRILLGLPALGMKVIHAVPLMIDAAGANLGQVDDMLGSQDAIQAVSPRRVQIVRITRRQADQASVDGVAGPAVVLPRLSVLRRIAPIKKGQLGRLFSWYVLFFCKIGTCSHRVKKKLS